MSAADHTRVRTYDKVVEMLNDGHWHRDDEIALVATFPEAWLHEVERDGGRIVRRPDDPRYLRLVTSGATAQ
ncbi:MAG: hypothetical protein H0V45_09440 [Actinobacteria bacterium]|nr:hypothetical protein [Actinomycetota bacterium]